MNASCNALDTKHTLHILKWLIIDTEKTVCFNDLSFL